MFSFFGNRQRGFAVVGFGVNVGAVDQQVFHDGEVPGDMEGQTTAAEVEPTTLPAKGHRNPAGRAPGPAATSPADDAIAELLRLVDGDLLMAAGNRAGEGVIASAIRGYRG